MAKVLDTSRQNVYNLAKAGTIRAVVFKAGGNRFTYRFRQEDLENFVLGHLNGKAEAGR